MVRLFNADAIQMVNQNCNKCTLLILTMRISTENEKLDKQNAAHN